MFTKVLNSFGIRIIGVMFAYALNLLITRQYEQDIAGIYFWLISFILFFSPIISFGLPVMIMKETAKNKGISKIYAVKVSTILLIAFLASYLVIFLISEFQENIKFNYLFIIFPACLLYSLIMSFSEVFRGASSFKNYTIALFLVMQVSLFIINIVNEGNLDNLIFNYYVSCMIAMLYVTILLNKHLIKLDKKYSIKTMAYESHKVMFSSVLQSIVTYVAIIATGLFCDVDQVALLHVATRSALLLGFLITAINTVIGPKLACYEKDKKGFEVGVIETQNLLGKFLILLIPSCVILSYFSEWILSLFGDTYTDAANVFRMLLIAQVVNVISGPVILILNVTGNQHLALKSIFISTITIVILCLVLIPYYGYKGAAIATAIAIIIQNVAALINVKRRLGFWLLPKLKQDQIS